MLDSKNFTKYLNRHEIDAAVLSLANRLNDRYKDKEVVMVGVLKGSVLFLADLVRAIKFDPKIEFVRMVSYGKTKESLGTISFLKDIHTDLHGKDVLIVAEIVDSARTLRFLYDRVMKAEPASCEIVTLLDKTNKRAVDLPVNFVGVKTNDQFLVGYGLDLEEQNRNLPDIYYLKYPN